MKTSIAAPLLFAVTIIGCTPANPNAAPPANMDSLVPPVKQSSPVMQPSIDPTKPDFDLAENVTYEELKDISDRIRTECDRRKLSDLACLTLSNQKLRAASIARWNADGKKWTIRDTSSPLYRR
jgi:hypothetical protein